MIGSWMERKVKWTAEWRTDEQIDGRKTNE